MRCAFAFALAACLALSAGCGKKGGPGDDNPADPKGGLPAGASKLTLDNVKRIQIGVSTLNDARQTFGGQGELTNDDKPGLGTGSKWVWKEDNKKVYVSIGIDAKATGVAWEGFGGK